MRSLSRRNRAFNSSRCRDRVRIASITFVTYLPTRADRDATRVVTCPTITGVASPSVNTASAAHEITDPTNCAIASRTRSWMIYTIVDAICKPVPIAPAHDPAACR